MINEDVKNLDTTGIFGLWGLSGQPFISFCLDFKVDERVGVLVLGLKKQGLRL